MADIRHLTAQAAIALVALAGVNAWASEAALDKAQALAQRHLLIDTHIDVPYRLQEDWEDVTRATERGEFDLPRARAGGLDIPFMSIYTPAEMEAEGGSFQLANRLIDSVEAMVTRAPDQLVIVHTPAGVDAAFEAGKIGLAMGMENGSPLERKLENVRYFHDRGISYITLTHSLSNQLSDSSYDDNRPLGGLSEFGREVVREMNRVGMMVDISHVSDQAFYQVLEISQAPVIASHSSARHFTPGFERNMSDEMIVALAEHVGVIQINFGSSFVTEEARAWSDVYWKLHGEHKKANGLADGSPELAQFSKDYREKKPFPFASLDNVLDHFDHVVKLVGIDYVGLGSDYDGVGDSLPVGLKDVSTFPALVAGLLGRGYSEDDIAKILGGNLMRVWRQVEAVAQR
jgi:membrane dipeptidase